MKPPGLTEKARYPFVVDSLSNKTGIFIRNLGMAKAKVICDMLDYSGQKWTADEMALQPGKATQFQIGDYKKGWRGSMVLSSDQPIETVAFVCDGDFKLCVPITEKGFNRDLRNGLRMITPVEPSFGGLPFDLRLWFFRSFSHLII